MFSVSNSPSMRVRAVGAFCLALLTAGIITLVAPVAGAVVLESCSDVNSEEAYHECLEDIDAAGDSSGPFEILLTGDIVLTDAYSPVHRYRLTPDLEISAAEGVGVVVSSDPGNTGDTAFLNIDEATVTVSGVVFDGVTTQFGLFRVGTGTLVLDRVTVNDVTATGSSGGALVTSSGGAVHILDSTVSDVTGGPGAGAINLFGTGPSAAHELVVVNSHVEDASFGSTIAGGGGFVRMLSGTATIQDSTFAGSYAPEGGAFRLQGVTAIIENSEFSGGEARYGGAAIYADGSDVQILDSTFADNAAGILGDSSQGGAIRASNTELSVIASDFSNNTSHTSGGALQVAGVSPVTIEGSTFTSNSSGTQGGAVSISAPTTIADGTSFFMNESGWGGALYANNEVSIADASFVMNGRTSEFTSSGGALMVGSIADVEVVRTSFEGNLASYGGAVNVQNGGVLSIERSSVLANTGHVTGHVAHASGSGAIINVSHSTLAHNADGPASTMFVSNANLNLNYVTVVDTLDEANTSGYINAGSSSANISLARSAFEITDGDICGSMSSATVTSSGHNWMTDATCLSVIGVGDTTNGTSLMLADLNRNDSGPLLSFAPTAASPIVDMLPWGNLGCNGASEFYDQRGMYRPFGGFPEDCTIGAVEYTPEWSLELDVVFRDAPYAQVGSTVEFDVEATNTGLLPLTELAVTSDDIPGLACAMDNLGVPEAELWIAPDDTLTLVCDGAELELTSADFDSDPATLSLHVTADSAEQAGEIDDQGSFEIPLDREAALDLSIDTSVTLVEAVASTVPVTVTNTGNVTVDVTLDQTPAVATWDGACAGEFTLGAGDEQQCTLTYTPTSADGDAGEVHVTVNATGDPAVGGTIGASDGPVAITVEAAGFEAPTTPSFSDVGLTHPFFEEIEWLAWKGVTGGYDDGTFRPGAPVSRQAMAAFLYRFAGEPEFEAPATASFPDVPTTHPFFEEIEWLAAEGVTGGYGDGTFRPGAAVSRQAMAAFLYRFQGEPAFTPPATASFPDVPTSHPFYAEIEWLVDVNITTGYNDGTFRGGASVSRQAMAAFLQRLDAL